MKVTWDEFSRISKGPFLEFKEWFDNLSEEGKKEVRDYAVHRIYQVLLDYFEGDEAKVEDFLKEVENETNEC